MKYNSFKIAILVSALAGGGNAYAFLGIGNGWDNEYCRITFQDKGCGDDGFLIELQNGSDSNSDSKDECKNMPWPTTADLLEVWAKKKIFGNGIITRLDTEIDQSGNVLAMFGKPLKKCFNKKNHKSNKWSTLSSNVQFTLPPQSCNCGAGMIADANGACKMNNVVVMGDGQNSVTTMNSGFTVMTNQGNHETGVNTFGNDANKDLMTAGGSLADQGLIAKTLDTSAVAAGAGETSKFDPSKLAGGLVTDAGSGSAAKTNSGANGGGLISLGGDGVTSPKDVSLASITGSDGAYQFRGGSAGSDGGSGSEGGGRAFTGSEIGGGAALSGNGQTPGMEFGGDRGPASADGSGANGLGGVGANGRLGEDPNDYFTRIGLGDNLFKIVEKRYRSQQTGWVLNQPSAKK